MDTWLRVVLWVLDGVLGVVGDDLVLLMDMVVAVMVVKWEVVLVGIEVCDLVMDVVGGVVYYCMLLIVCCYRDVRGSTTTPKTASQPDRC